MSAGDVDRLLARMPDCPQEKLFVITNGFDESKFAGLSVPNPVKSTGPLRMLYVGTMYPRSGDTTAKALRILAARGYDQNDIEFSIIGFSDESFDRLVDEYNVGHFVNNHGFMNHVDLISSYRFYDVMYLLTGGTPYYHAGALPSKIFEYMRIGKPILHAGIKGTTHEILSKSGLEIFVPLEDAFGIADKIIDLIARKKASSLSMQPNLAYIKSFEWRFLVNTANGILLSAS
jgi:hypothetical protein